MKKFLLFSVLSFCVILSGCAYTLEILNVNDIGKVREMAKDKGFRDQIDHGTTALMAAIAMDQTEKAVILIEAGADLNVKDGHYQTALIYAMEKKNMPVIKAMLKAKPNLELQTKWMTPIWFAIHDGNFELVKMLLEAGANVNSPNENGETPIFVSASTGDADMMKLLLSHKADAKAVSNDGSTPLMFAASQGNPAVMELLIKAGCNLNGFSKKGFNALTGAITANKLDNFNYLMKAGINFKIVSTDGQYLTPLMIAVTVKNAEMVKSLIQKGADVNVKFRGHSLLELAKSQDTKDITELLIAAGAK